MGRIETKAFDNVELTATPQGRFRALVARFNVPDKIGDIIRPGAFAATIQAHRAAGAPVTVVYGHQWADPENHIGHIKAEDLRETSVGLEVEGELYLDEPVALKVFKQLQRKALREWSFAYEITKFNPLAKGARELLGLTLKEIGPCLAGVGDTATLAVKSTPAVDAMTERRKDLARAQLAPFQARLDIAKRRLALARVMTSTTADR